MYNFDKKSFREIDHTADIGIEVTGNDLPGLFANALFGMTHILFGDHEPEPVNTIQISLTEPSLPDLLVSWLSEMNYRLSVGSFFVAEIQRIEIQNNGGGFKLIAQIRGDDIRGFHDQMQTEIKAVTYHQMLVEERQGGWFARVIFDI